MTAASLLVVGNSAVKASPIHADDLHTHPAVRTAADEVVSDGISFDEIAFDEVISDGISFDELAFDELAF